MKKDNFERALRLEERKKVRQRNIIDYFIDFSRHHRPWVQELADKYKSRGDFPMIPMAILPSYYESNQDKEIAAFAGLLLEADAEFEQIQAFREMLGDKPMEWFRNREFVKLSLGSMLDKRTGGVLNWKIAKLMDRLWQECHVTTEKILWVDEVIFLRPLGVQVEFVAQTQYCSYFDVLTYLLEDCCIGDYFYKLRLLLMVLGTSDGFGMNLWTVSPSELKCPLTHDLRMFLSTWFPDCRRIGGVDDAIRLFGLRKECDFFYAWLGYKELQKIAPKECSQYATSYLRWYESGIKKTEHIWKGILPKILF